MKKIYTMAAMALLMTACSNNIDELQAQQQPANSDGMITITAKLAPKSEAGTRAVTPGTDSNGKDIIEVTWAEDEHLAILYEVNSTKYEADARISYVDEYTGIATVTFAVESSTADDTPCTIVYPKSAAKGDHSGVKDAATLLAAQDGTLNANLDVRVGAGTITTTTPNLIVTTQPAAQFAIFKFTTKNSDGSATIDVRPLTINIGSQNFVITPASATNVLYVALPAVSSQTVNFLATSSDGETKYSCSKVGVSFTASNYYQSVLKMKPGVLPGSFTINASGNKVYFSQGNLQATTTDLGQNWTWAFATNQWDYIGGTEYPDDPNATTNNKINVDGTVSQSGTVDLFTWVGASNINWEEPLKYGLSTLGYLNSDTGHGNVASESLKSDWGTLAISNGGNTENAWRTLSSAEWGYLLGTRTNANQKFGFGSVNGVNGLIILPDSWMLPADLTFTAGNSDWANSYTTDQWSQMAAAGAVFFPKAGYRDNTYLVPDFVQYGAYWSSSSTDVNCAYYMTFKSGNLKPQVISTRNIGMSVRLVRNAE